MNSTREDLHVSIQATYGGYPCRIRTLGPTAVAIEQTLHLPPQHRAHLSFHAAGEWFHLLAEVERSAIDREFTRDAARPVYRTVVQLRNVPDEVAAHLGQLLDVLALGPQRESVHTEALQFEIVGA